MIRLRWFLAALVLTATSCGAATYNEGDNDDQSPINECADIDHRPDDCED